MVRKLTWWTTMAVLLLLLFYAGVMLFVYTYSLKDDTQKADVAIVLGAAVWMDEPSPVFKERIDHGISLYKEGYVDHLIFTGGKYDADTRSESSVAKEYALSKGIPEEHIFIEETSSVTVENLQNAKQIMEEEGFETALLVSDPLHMSRSAVIAHHYDMKTNTSPTPHSAFQSWDTKLPFLLHETTYLAGYLLLYPTQWMEPGSVSPET